MVKVIPQWTAIRCFSADLIPFSLRLLVLLSSLWLLSGLAPSHAGDGVRIPYGGCNAPGLKNGRMDISHCDAYGSVWFLEVDGAEDLGYYFPEKNALYWVAVLPKIYNDAAHYEIHGHFAYARFSSFQSYVLKGSPLDAIYDQDIEARRGSVNPVQEIRDYPEDARLARLRYKIDVVEVETLNQLESGLSNTLQVICEDNTDIDGSLHPCVRGEGGNHMLIYRIYADEALKREIPPGYSLKEWIQQGQVPMPKIYYVVDDRRKQHYRTVEQLYRDMEPNLEIIRLAKKADWLGDRLAPVLGALPAGIPRFASPETQWFLDGNLIEGVGSMFVNYPFLANWWDARSGLPFDLSPNSATSYFAGFLNMNYGDVQVTRFKAPTFPNPDNGDLIDPGNNEAPGQQLRYWSVCMNNTFTLYTTGCLKDSEIEVDEDGYVTMAFSNGHKRPLDSRTGQPYKNWLEASSPLSLVIIRHMLPAPHFIQSPHFYKEACVANPECDLDEARVDYEAIQSWSGEYAPKSKYCSTRQFHRDRCQGSRGIRSSPFFSLFRR